MIQNISQNRENKRVTRNDIMQIAHAMWLPFFGGGMDHYSVNAPTTTRTYKMPHGYTGQIELYCFKGMGEGKAKLCWIVNANCALGPDVRNIDVFSSGNRARYSPIKSTIGLTYEFNNIYKGFSVEQNKMKIITITRFWGGVSFSNGQSANTKTMGERLGLLMVSINQNLDGTYLHHAAIFTPKPGLFDETPPS